jgi:nucleotide-binding universal stress UspA family protein
VTFRSIVVPLDGSHFGEQIIPPAVAVGALTGAAYRLLRVVPRLLLSGDRVSLFAVGGRTAAGRQFRCC